VPQTIVCVMVTHSANVLVMLIWEDALEGACPDNPLMTISVVIAADLCELG